MTSIWNFTKRIAIKKKRFESWLEFNPLMMILRGLVESEIEVKRIKEKSFFNFFWLCFADGLKKPPIKHSFCCFCFYE
jgi:hypothetical protein